MNIQYIYHKIRKQTLISAIIPAVFLVFLIMTANRYPFKDIFAPNCYTGAVKLDKAFSSVADYMELSDVTLYYTGYDSVKDSQIVGKYFYAIEDNQCFFFLLNSEKALKAADSITVNNLKLKLVLPDSDYDNFLMNLSQDIDWQYTHLSEVSASHIAVEYHNILSYSYAFALLLAVMGIYSLCVLFLHVITFICPKVKNVLFPKTSFKIRRILFQKLALELDEENSLNSLIPLVSSKHTEFYVTPSFIINFSLCDTYIIPLKNILWIYKHSKKVSHGMSELPSIYTLHIVLTTGTHIQFKHYNEKNADALIALLSNKNPNILTGYSQAHKALAKKYLNYLHTAKRHG